MDNPPTTLQEPFEAYCILYRESSSSSRRNFRSVKYSTAVFPFTSFKNHLIRTAGGGKASSIMQELQKDQLCSWQHPIGKLSYRRNKAVIVTAYSTALIGTWVSPKLIDVPALCIRNNIGFLKTMRTATLVPKFAFLSSELRQCGYIWHSTEGRQILIFTQRLASHKGIVLYRHSTYSSVAVVSPPHPTDTKNPF